MSKPFETIMDLVEVDRPLLNCSSQMVGLSTLPLIPEPFRIAKLTKHFAQLAADDKV